MKKLTMTVINPNAAGIDVGSRSHLVAVDQPTLQIRAPRLFENTYPERQGEFL
jgi:hypothetical protein